MALCVIGATMDTDNGNQLAPACNVHCYWTPCPCNGEPASSVPLEADDEHGREAALKFWTVRTKRQRPLVLHHGSWADERDHSGKDCWCCPEFFSPVDLVGSVHPGSET